MTVYTAKIGERDLTLAIVLQLDEVPPEQVEPMFRFKMSDPGVVRPIYVVGEHNGMTVRSRVYPANLSTSGIAHAFVSDDLHTAWADLPLVLL